MSGTGIAAKTNFGLDIQGQKFHKEAGSPSLENTTQATATVRDIRMPGEYNKRTGAGILVRVDFDLEEYRNDNWIALKDSYELVRSLVGNREAVLKTPPRVLVTFNILRPSEGYAELICDNKQEEIYNSYERNPSSLFINILSGLKTNTKAIG